MGKVKTWIEGMGILQAAPVKDDSNGYIVCGKDILSTGSVPHDYQRRIRNLDFKEFNFDAIISNADTGSVAVVQGLPSQNERSSTLDHHLLRSEFNLKNLYDLMGAQNVANPLIISPLAQTAADQKLKEFKHFFKETPQLSALQGLYFNEAEQKAVDMNSGERRWTAATYYRTKESLDESLFAGDVYNWYQLLKEYDASEVNSVLGKLEEFGVRCFDTRNYEFMRDALAKYNSFDPKLVEKYSNLYNVHLNEFYRTDFTLLGLVQKHDAVDHFLRIRNLSDEELHRTPELKAVFEEAETTLPF
jgi:hypothetical protein